MQGVVNVNGLITGAADAVVSVFDHGFLYGEGVYETLRTYGRRPFHFTDHADRLRRSAALIALPVPMDDASLAAEVDRTMDACDGEELYIRLLLTRGVGDLSYSLTATPTPSLIVIVKPLPVMPARIQKHGIRVALVGVRRNHVSALNPLIKSNNLMNNALAMQEAYRRGAEEAVMLNHDGHVVECAQANIFVVKHGRLATPSIAAGLLPGITRQVVLSLAAANGIPAEERLIAPDEVTSADELFITSTTREITPVSAIDDTAIGNSLPGPTTQRLMAAFHASVLSSADERNSI